MSDSMPILRELDRAAAALSEAATHLTFVMIATGDTPLGNDAYLLSEAVEKEM